MISQRRATRQPTTAMLLRTKLIITTLACGILPMAVAITVQRSQSSDMIEEVVESEAEVLEQRALDGLVSLNDACSTLISQALVTIEKQVSAFAANPEIRRATLAFSEALAQGEWHTSPDIARERVQEYYRQQFDPAFRASHPGSPPVSAAWLDQLDGTAIQMQERYIASNPNPPDRKGDLAAPTQDTLLPYDETHREIQPYASALQQSFGYADILLLEPADGRVVYSVGKSLDYGTRLRNGPHADSGLGRVFQRAMSTGRTVFTDHASYGPSMLAPAAFVGTPIRHDGAIVGVAVFRFSLDHISALIARISTDSEHAEALLIGADGLMRCNSIQAPDSHNVQASWAASAQSRIDNAATRAIFGQGDSGSGRIVDHRGEQVLAAWSPVDFGEHRWALVTKQDAEHALAAVETARRTGEAGVSNLLTSSLVIMALCILASGGISWWIATSITKPVRTTADSLRNVAEGNADLSRRLDGADETELGQVAHWFNVFMQRLQQLVQHLTHQSEQLGTAAVDMLSAATLQSDSIDQTKQQASQVAAASEQMSTNLVGVGDASGRMSASIRNVAAAIEEMSASISGVAGSSDDAARIADEAAALVEENNERISKLGIAANEIGRVIETIQDIAEQTNLLALNATIEAARAGEAGKGFSVVANEVKELAAQTAEATMDIRRRIESIQESTGSAVDGTTRIAEVILAVNEASKAIAHSVAEQQQATEEIARNLSTTSHEVQVVNTAVQESAAAGDEISRSIAQVDAICGDSVGISSSTQRSGETVVQVCQELSRELSAFEA